jgi:Na+/melibiose symporter-like transporter
MSEHARGGLAKPILVSYALPALVLALPTIPVYIYLPTLYGVELGLGLAVTGLVLLGARLFDTVTDPLVGALSDRFAVRGSRRKPWIAVGTVIAGLGLFNILNPPPAVDSGYLLGWSMVLYAGWTMVAVPYMAWGAELSTDYNERTRITSWREGFMLLGIVGAGAVNAFATQSGWTERDAIGAIAWVAIGLGIVVVPLLLWKVPDRAAASPTARTGMAELRGGLASLIRNRPFLRLLSAWFLNGIANGIPAALFFIYLEHGLGADAAERPLFVLAYFVAAIVTIPLWSALSRRFGKHRVWCWAMAAACGAFLAVPLIPEGAFVAFAIVCVVTGMALGADLVLPPAIQADVVDYDELRSGRSRVGLQFALWGMCTKFALAAAVGLALPVLDASGFDPAAPTDSGKSVLTVIYALVPVVIKVTAIAIVWRFPLTAEKHAVIRRRLGRLRPVRNNLAEAAS